MSDNAIKAILIALTIALSGAFASLARADVSYQEYSRVWDAVKSVGIGIYATDKNLMGYFEPASKGIYINTKFSDKDQRETLIHEAVHLVQFCRGNGSNYNALFSFKRAVELSQDNVLAWVMRNYDQEDHHIEIEAESYALGQWTFNNGDLADRIYQYCS